MAKPKKIDYQKTYPTTYNYISALKAAFPQYKKYKHEDFFNLYDQIARVETNDQNIAQIGGGPGRGYYQVEGPSAKTAYARSQNIAKELEARGQKIKLPTFKEDFTQLDKDSQTFYITSNLIGAAAQKRKKDPNYYLDPTNPEKAWLELHWAGDPKDLPARQKRFREVNPVQKAQIEKAITPVTTKRDVDWGNLLNTFIQTPTLLPVVLQANFGETPQKKNGGPVYNWIPPNYPRVGARNEQGGWLDAYEDNSTINTYNGGSYINTPKYVPVNETTSTPLSPSKIYNPSPLFAPTEGQEAMTSIGVGAIPYLGDAVDIYNGIKSMQEGDVPGTILNFVGAGLPFIAGQTLQLGWDKLNNYATNYWKKRQLLNKNQKKADGSWVQDSSIPTPTTPSYYPAYPDRTLTTRQMGTPKAPMYAAGSTVWTKQDTPLWAGTPTPTSTQANYKNSRAISPESAIPYPEVTYPKSARYFTQAPVMQGYNPYKGPMRLHAPDTTRMEQGGRVTSDYKKRVGIPYAISPGISNAGMYVGPTTQRGITFGDGGDVPPYVTSDPKKFAERNKAFRDSSLAYNLSRRNELIFVEDPFDSRLPKYQEEMNILAKQLNFKPYKYKQGWSREEMAEFSASNPDAEYYLQSDEPYIGLFKKPTQKVIFNPEVTKMLMRGMPEFLQEESVPQKVKVPAHTTIPPQYMDTRGEWSSTPQVPPGYTPEQLLKMGYRAPQKKANGGWLDKYQGGSTVRDMSKPYLNPAMVQAVLANADKPVTTTTGRVVSTPASREKERREKIVAKDPSKYSVEDYKKGIQEPGAENDVLSDPIAMAAALTAGGVGLGAYGLTQVPRMFARNLASEATAGLSDYLKLKRLKPNITSSVDNVGRNLTDLQEAKKFAQQYGYELPTNLERISQSNMLTDRTIRGMMDRHNTFVRGVSTNWDEIAKRNPEILRHLENKGFDLSTKEGTKQAAEYMATHVPIKTGYGRASLDKEVFERGEDAIYTSNSIPTAEGYTYGQGYITKVKRPTDFSSLDRKDWINQNNPKYYDDAKILHLYKMFKRDETEDMIKDVFSANSPHLNKSHAQKIEEIKKRLNRQPGEETAHDIKLLEENSEFISGSKYDHKLLRTEKADEETFKNLTYYPSLFKRMQLTVPNFKEELSSILNNDQIYNNSKYTNSGLAAKRVNEIAYEILHKKGITQDNYAHYLHIGTPGEKLLEPIKSWEITPEIWKNKSRAHTNKYSKKLSVLKYGGFIEIEGAGVLGAKALQQPEKKAQGGPIYNWIPNYPRVGVRQYNKKQSGGWLDNL